MTDSELTAQAYKYAKDVKKVNLGVIEAYKKGFRSGEQFAQSLNSKSILKMIAGRYRSRKMIEHDLGYDDARRSLNDQEIQEANTHEKIVKFIEELGL
ncbi:MULTISPECIES: hypothetical protein [unclassified Myroides]|uniref:hypothetical protein n=1 Tax=unclassified Myroides TaxID=2642485 RepID=UPI003D2F65FB